MNRTLTVIYGPPKVGKTSFAIHLALTALKAGEYLGQPVNSQPGSFPLAFYVADSLVALSNRISAWEGEYGDIPRRAFVRHPIEQLLPKAVEPDLRFLIADWQVEPFDLDAWPNAHLIVCRHTGYGSSFSGTSSVDAVADQIIRLAQDPSGTLRAIFLFRNRDSIAIEYRKNEHGVFVEVK